MTDLQPAKTYIRVTTSSKDGRSKLRIIYVSTAEETLGNTFPAALSAFIASRTPGNFLPATAPRTAAPKSTGSFSLGSTIWHPAQYDAKGDALEERSSSFAKKKKGGKIKQ